MRAARGLLLVLVASACRAVTVPAGPGLALDFDEPGTLGGLNLDDRPAPLLAGGGWQVTDVGRGPTTVTWLGLEAQWPANHELRLTGPMWHLGAGWRLSGSGPRTGPAALWQAAAPSHGDALRLILPAQPETVYVIRVPCRARRLKGEIRFGALPLNGLGKAAGEWIPGDRLSGPPPDGEWHDLTCTIAAPPGAAMVTVWLALEQAAGSLEVGGAEVTSHAPGPTLAFSGRLTAQSDGARFEGRADDLQLAVDYRSSELGLTFEARLSATGPADRAVALRFGVPLDGTGWNWWHSLERKALIGDTPGQRLATWRQLGDGHLYSPYPVACVNRAAPAQGLAVAVPPRQPVLSRAWFDAAGGLWLAFDLGLSPSAGQASATVGGALFATDAAWGMRSAVERFQRLYAADLTGTATRYGAWFSGVNPQMVPTPSRFGLLYDEQSSGHLPWARSNDLKCLAPLLPWGLYSRPGAPAEAAAGGAYPLGAVGAPTMPSGGDLLDAEARPVAWTTADHVTFRPWCTSPQLLADGPAGRVNALLAELLRGEDGRPLDGLALDGVGADWAGWAVDDHAPAHLPLARAPLSHSRLTRRPVVLSAVVHSEYLRDLSERLRRRGQLVLGSLDAATALPFVAPWLDVVVLAEGVPDDERLMWARVVAGRKPLSFVDPLLLDTTGLLDERRECWRQALLWAAFPGAPGWLGRRAAEVQAPLFDLCVPLLRSLAGAGWEPVPYAVVSDAALRLERYGHGDALRLVLANNTERSRAATLTLDPQPLGLVVQTAGGSVHRRLVFSDQMSRTARTVECRVVLDRWQASLTVPARSVVVLAPLPR